MKAIQVDGERLVWTDAPTPKLDPGSVRIQVAATAVNRADLVQRSGGYPPPPGASPILGLECSGTVAEVGEGVTRVQVGDAVCALLSGGGYAEEVVVPAGQVLPTPSSLDFTQAAAVPEVFATAYLNLFMEAKTQPGERVLIHAGASGVGTAAIALCRELGNPCYVTVGSADKLAQCLALGAAAGCNRHETEFGEQVSAWTNGAGMDVILDPVGAGYLGANLASLALEGRLVIIGLMSGAQSEVNLGLMMMKRLRVIGSTLRARSIAAKAQVMDELQAQLWPLLESQKITPVIHQVLPITEAEEAHRLMAADENIGKLVLRVAD